MSRRQIVADIRARGGHSCDVLRWRRDRTPDAEGYWLRYNVGHRVTMHRVLALPEGLRIDWGSGDTMGLVPLDHSQLRGWVWYGPIEPPSRFAADPRPLGEEAMRDEQPG